jgi:hypothetical protein
MATKNTPCLSRPGQDDWRSKLELPDSFAAIQAQMQETIERKARPYLCATEESDEPTADLANCILEYNMNNTDLTAVFPGQTSRRYPGHFLLNGVLADRQRRVKDPTGQPRRHYQVRRERDYRL